MLKDNEKEYVRLTKR